MIKVSFDIDESRKMVSLHMKGHAGMSTVGNDVVCSAASILAYTLAQTAVTAYEMGKLKYKPTAKLNSGSAVVTVRAKEDTYWEMVHAAVVIQTGFLLLANNYPNFVTVKAFGEDE